MKLYFFPVAPNPTKVRLYLEEKRGGGASIEIEEVLVNLREGQQKTDAHLSRNPLGKLPVLELDDGSFLCESLAIIEYLEERFPEAPMIGSDLEERARQRELERIADLGVLGWVVRIVHATNSPLGLPANPEVAAHARAALPDALGLLDDVLSDGRDCVMGPSPSVADCTLAAALQFARFGGVELPPGLDHLKDWDERFRKRPSAQAVLVA